MKQDERTHRPVSGQDSRHDPITAQVTTQLAPRCSGSLRKAAREAEARRTGPADRGGRRRVRSSRLLPGW